MSLHTACFQKDQRHVFDVTAQILAPRNPTRRKDVFDDIRQDLSPLKPLSNHL